MKTHAVDWKCKLCQKPITLQVSLECPIDWAESLAKLACCDRCYDFHDASERCGSKIVDACFNLMATRYGKQIDHDKEKKIAESLTYLTKAYCRVASEYYRVNNLWDEAFVSLLMEKPDRARDSLRLMNQFLRKPATRPVHETRLLEDQRPVSADP